MNQLLKHNYRYYIMIWQSWFVFTNVSPQRVRTGCVLHPTTQVPSHSHSPCQAMWCQQTIPQELYNGSLGKSSPKLPAKNPTWSKQKSLAADDFRFPFFALDPGAVLSSHHIQSTSKNLAENGESIDLDNGNSQNCAHKIESTINAPSKFQVFPKKKVQTVPLHAILRKREEHKLMIPGSQSSVSIGDYHIIEKSM